MVEYNLPNEKGRDKFQWYDGRNTEQMPNLIAEGRAPMNTSQLMQRKLDLRNGPAEVKTAWIDNYFDTGDAVVYHPEGAETLVVLDSRHLKEIQQNPNRLNNGAWLLSEDKDEAFAIYEGLKKEDGVYVFKKGKSGKTNDWMSKADVKAHPVWKVLARDQALLNDYTDFIFREYQSRFAKNISPEDVRAMGVYLRACGGDKPEMRAWCVVRLVSRSGAYGGGGLGSDSGRLVGIAPEALGAPGKGASNIRAHSMADVQIDRKQLDQIAEFMKPESVDKVKSLLGKL